jgi:glycyl-tRNA synthetase
MSVVTLEKLVSLCKRRGFVYQSAEIYGGLNGIYDIGPVGVQLRNNIRTAWIQSLKNLKFNGKLLDILFLEGALLGPEAMWQASGHTTNFHDPLVDCLVCKHRFRADDIDLSKPCPNCGNKNWTEVREFHLMFKTQVGAAVDQTSIAYLRPETAQAIFVNFKNIMSSNRVKIPFGAAQLGKAFRNEITPKQFLFRMREFEQMEIEWFCAEQSAQEFFKFWIEARQNFYQQIGIAKDKIRIRPHEQDELSHYSSMTSDVDYHFPFGWKELEGIAYRGNYDLSQHAKFSGKDLSVFDEATQQSYIPHVVECSVGLDRLFLTVLFDAYKEEMDGEEMRVVLQLHPRLAPVKAAFFPLTKAQAPAMEKIYQDLMSTMNIEMQYDLSGSIGKRYRRQDEIGTPLCFTYDFESDIDKKVTVRNRDTMQQERINIDAIPKYITDMLQTGMLKTGN